MDINLSRVRAPFRRAFLSLTLGLLAACTTTTSQLDTADDLLHSGNSLAHAQYLEANNSMVELHNRGAVYDDAASRQLIDRVLDRLFPGKHNNPVRVTMARLPGENAYALPTGDIVLHQSMLAALTSEAQLAFVLAHEAAHVFLNHAWLSANHRSKKRAAAHLTDILFFGNSRSYGYFANSVEAYSRQQEYDADTYAANILIQAGYDLDDAGGFFNALQRYPMVYEAAASQRTHPAINERKRRLALLSQQMSLPEPALAAALSNKSTLQAQEFMNHRKVVLDRSIQDKIEEHDLPGALLQIDELESLTGDGASTDCLRGKLYAAIASDVQEAGKAVREIFPLEDDDARPSSASVFFLEQAAAIYEERMQKDSADCAVQGLKQIEAQLENPRHRAQLDQPALPASDMSDSQVK